MKEMVIHPDHYNVSGRKECWDEMKELFGDAAVAIFDCLSAYKYRYRAGEKDGNPEEQDKAKIENYMAHAAWIVATCDNDLAKSVFKKMLEVLKSDKD